MMNRSSKGKGIEAKQEDNDPNNNENNNLFKAPPPSTSSSRQWSAFRNPRIVRVSRSFGGKDRHSKVCTIRGLRDRRIRLSVPTAIQLYGLQDRLGLTQPSKVVDWLLDATKNDIDNLPPLQMPQGFGQFHHPQMLLPHHDLQPSISPFLDATLSFTKDGGFQHHSLGIKMNTSSTLDDHNTMGIRSSKSTNWGLEGEAEGEASFRDEINGKGKMIRTSTEDENENGLSLSAQKLFPLASTNSSLPSFFNNNPPNMPLNPYNYHWDASSLSLSQFGIVPQPENNSSSVQLPSSLAGGGGGGGGSQFFFCPPVPVTMPSFFPQYPSPFATPPLDNNNETRELSHFHFLNSGLAHSNRNNGTGGGQTHKDQNADP